MTPVSRGKTWWGLGLVLVLVLLGGLYFSGLVTLPFGSHSATGPAVGPTAKAEEKTKLWRCPMHPQIVRDSPSKCPVCGMDLVPVPATPAPGAPSAASPAVAPAAKAEEKTKVWRCPMHPEIVRDAPGQCPKCGMELVPVTEDAGAGAETPGVIAVSPTTVQSMGVRTAKVEVRPLSRLTLTVGLVTFNERGLSTITTKVNGWLERLYINATGDPVRKGQALVSIYSPELVASQEEYLLAARNFKAMKNSPLKEMVDGARRLAEASRRRLAYFDVSAAQIESLERTGQVKKNLTLTSPANGIVTKRMVTQGMYVQAGMPLLEVADLSTVWVDADIYQYELPWIKVGQPVTMTLDYLPGETFAGKIDYIYPYLKEATRTAKVRLRFRNPGLKLKPEMFAQVKIESPVSHQAVVVPADAVIDTGLKQNVFIALGEGRFEPREVKLGVLGNDGMREVLAGLKGGEDVVTSAQFMLDSESRFREAVQMMLPAQKPEGKPGETPEKKTGAPKETPAPMPPGHKH